MSFNSSIPFLVDALKISFRFLKDIICGTVMAVFLLKYGCNLHIVFQST